MVDLSLSVTVLIITLFYLIMFLISFDRLKLFNKKYWMFLRVISYTLYLLNSIAGSLILQYYENVMNKYLVLRLFLSFSISKFIEKPFCLKINQF
jgi:peptidoglycan/LPS O-acetylase OafA/YrhL